MPTTSPIIGVDLIAGDAPAMSLFQGLFEMNGDFNVHLKFFVPQNRFKEYEEVAKNYTPHFSYSFVKTKSIIKMDDDPLSSIRLKKNAGIPLALKALKNGEIDAFVSNGNTGALICGATLILKLLECIKRPGLLALLPTKSGNLAVIDVGANVNCGSEHLVHFAKMGIAFQKCCNIQKPKVGLLNIGVERKKGRKEMREAYEALQKVHKASFVGNIEGFEAFQGSLDVLVTDGVSGNIFLKTAEGMTAFILDLLKENKLEPRKQAFSKLTGILDYAEYPGALICGVEGIVVKCHGYSNAKAIHSAIKGATNLVRSQFLQKIKNQL